MELVWQDGQLLSRGCPRRPGATQNRQPKLVTASDPIFDDTGITHKTQKQQQADTPVALLELYQSHLNDAFSEQSYGGDAMDYDHTVNKDCHQVVPVVHETTRNSQHHDSPQPPLLKRARVEASPNRLVSVKKETTHISQSSRQPANFSIFLRSPEPPAVPTNTITTTSSNENLQQKKLPPAEPEAASACNSNGSKYGDKGKMEGGGNKESAAEAVVPSTSLCSLGASNNISSLKRSSYDGYEGEASAYCPSYDQSYEEKRRRKAVLSRRRTGGFSGGEEKRTPKRRDTRINKKMRALQKLIPNCNKMDEVAMLDEAIDYLKTLQFHVQMMISMGTGICMPPMLLPIGMQQHLMHAAASALQMSHHFPPIGTGTGMGMGMGVGCNPAAQNQGLEGHATAVPEVNQMPGFPRQPPLPTSMLRPPFMGLMPHYYTLPVSSVSQAAASMDLTNSKDSIHNVQIKRKDT